MGVRKRQMAERLKAEKKEIAFAKLNDCPTSPRKMRLVADLVRGAEVEKALAIPIGHGLCCKFCFLQSPIGKQKTKMLL